MRNISSGPLLSIQTFCSIQWFCLRTLKALIRLREGAGWSGPSLFAYARRPVFAQRGPMHRADRLYHLRDRIISDQITFQYLWRLFFPIYMQMKSSFFVVLDWLISLTDILGTRSVFIFSSDFLQAAIPVEMRQLGTLGKSALFTR